LSYAADKQKNKMAPNVLPTPTDIEEAKGKEVRGKEEKGEEGKGKKRIYRNSLNRSPRLLFSTIKSDPRLVIEARLLFEARLVSVGYITAN